MADLNRPVSELPLGKVYYTVLPNDSIHSALKKLKDNHIGSLVVVDESNTILGIFTERDYLRKIAGDEQGKLSEPIQNFMTPNPKTVAPTDPIKRAAIFMRLGKFRHIVIRDDKGQLSGVISIKDIMAWLMDEG